MAELSIPWTTPVIAVADVVALSAVLLAAVLRNPRLMLHKHPKDIQAAVPPKTSGERRETRWWAILILLLVLGPPVAAAVTARLRQPDLGTAGAFLNAFVVLLTFNLFDWLVLDWIVLCSFTPRFVVLPGTEGMAGYRDYGMHFRGFLIGLVLSLAASIIIGLLVTQLPAA